MMKTFLGSHNIKELSGEAQDPFIKMEVIYLPILYRNIILWNNKGMIGHVGFSLIFF